MPIHATLDAGIAPERLRAALSGKPITSVTLNHRVLEYQYCRYQNLPFRQLVPALAASAPQLTALHGLLLMQLQDSQRPGLAALSPLRA